MTKISVKKVGKRGNVFIGSGLPTAGQVRYIFFS